VPDPLDSFFDEQAAGLCHTDYWASLARIWREAGDELRRDERWRGVWEQARLAPGAQLGLMTDDEQAALTALPSEIALRARPDEGAQSWDVAGGDGDGDVTVDRDRVIALFLVDGAPQVIAPPAAVRA
jgi:hypothetical protein